MFLSMRISPPKTKAHQVMEIVRDGEPPYFKSPSLRQPVYELRVSVDSCGKLPHSCGSVAGDGHPKSDELDQAVYSERFLSAGR
jgi:hypothetical protein